MTTSIFGNKMITLGGSKDEKNIWNTKRVNKYLYNLENGIQQDGTGPFFEKKIGIRRGNLNFYLDQEEERELERCMSDVVYFANKYCFAMTDDGVIKITLRDYQKKILYEFQKNRFNIFLASRQVGKCFVPYTNLSFRTNDNFVDLITKNHGKIKRSTKFLETIKHNLYKLLSLLSI